MFASTESRESVRRALRESDTPQVAALRADRLDPLLGGTDWVTEHDRRLEELLDSWGLSDADRDALIVAAQQSDSDAGQALVAWFNETLDNQGLPGAPATTRADDRATPAASDPVDGGSYDQIEPASPEPGAADPADYRGLNDNQVPTNDVGPRYRDIAPVAGYPGWWAAWDTRADPADAWRYVPSDDEPTQDTDGWLDQATAFQSMTEAAAQPDNAAPSRGQQADPAAANWDTDDAVPAEPAAPAEAEERYLQIQAVAGHPGWWVAWDTLADPGDPWRYLRSEQVPTQDSQGWLDQATAFAQMIDMATFDSATFESATFESAPATADNADENPGDLDIVEPDNGSESAAPANDEQAEALATEVLAPAIAAFLQQQGPTAELSPATIQAAVERAMRLLQDNAQ